MSKYFHYLRYFIAFISLVFSCLYLIVFLFELYDVIDKCYSINRFSISVLNCIQVFYYEILKTSLFIVVLFLLAIFMAQKLILPFKSGG
jgi:hypothetical protein